MGPQRTLFAPTKEMGESRSPGPGRLTPLTISEAGVRVCSENRVFSAAKRLSRASICRSAAFGCGGSIPSLPTDVMSQDIEDTCLTTLWTGVYVVMGVHHPKPGMEKALLEVQERFGVAQRGHAGLISAFIWKDDQSEVLIGITLRDRKEDYDAARPDLDKALAGSDIRTLDASIAIYRGSPVAWT